MKYKGWISSPSTVQASVDVTIWQKSIQTWNGNKSPTADCWQQSIPQFEDSDKLINQVIPVKFYRLKNVLLPFTYNRVPHTPAQLVWQAHATYCWMLSCNLILPFCDDQRKLKVSTDATNYSAQTSYMYMYCKRKPPLLREIPKKIKTNSCKKSYEGEKWQCLCNYMPFPLRFSSWFIFTVFLMLADCAVCNRRIGFNRFV